MNRAGTIAMILGALLIVLVVAFAVRVTGHYPSVRQELGRVKLMQIDEPSQQRLATLPHEALVTYYVSGREHMPSQFRRIEREVVDVLDAMARASSGRFAYQIIDPESQPQRVRHAAHQRIAPFRVRSIARDAYSERTVWSSLHIAYGPHEAAIINGVSPEHLPRLQAMIVGQLEQKDQARQPVFAVSAGPAYTAFAGYLSQHGQVVRIDLNAGDEIPVEADVLYWMDPIAADARAVARIERFLESGRSAVLAGSRHGVQSDENGSLSLYPTAHDAEMLLASFGIRLIDGMVLDETSQSVPGEVAPMPARFLVRCIPPNQDFRSMRFLPNGHLLFAAPTPFALDRDVLRDRALTPTVLATTSNATYLRDMIYGPVDLASAEYHRGDAVTKLPLMLWLRPDQPWRGSLILSASSSPFRDGAFLADGFAHRRLVDVLCQTLASDERLVLHRAQLAGADPLPRISPMNRLLWRSFCIAMLPAVLLAIALRRGAWRMARQPAALMLRAAPLRAAAVALVLLIALAAVLSVVPATRADLTADKINRLSESAQAIAAMAVGEQAVAVTVVASRLQALPPEMRPLHRQLRSTLDELRRAGAELSVTWLHPEDLDEPALRDLHAQGIEPVRITTHDEDRTYVRSVYSTIVLEASGRREHIHLPDAASLELLEFRLAFALWRLQTGRRPHIAFAGDFPRLSAAEAYHDFQQRSLLAPTGADAYSLARAVLERADFRVTHIDPRRPELPEDIDLIVWMQPRRDILPLLDQVVQRLHQGVPVMIASQHFNMQARQYRGAGFEMVYWPQPQVTDLHLHYLPDLGVQLVHEVLFDELHGQMQLQTQVNHAAGQREYASQASALPFLIRASAANFHQQHPVMRNLGDQLLPFAAYWRLDDQRLAERGLTATTLMSTSQQAWTYHWTGGWIPPELLQPDNQVLRQQPLPLAVLVEGRFPLPAQPLTDRRADMPGETSMAEQPGEPSRMLLIGNSEMFKNDRLLDAAHRADHLLLNAAANLALNEDLAAAASHRRAMRGYGYVHSDERLRWRVIIVGTGPALMVVLGIGWFVARRHAAGGAVA